MKRSDNRIWSVLLLLYGGKSEGLVLRCYFQTLYFCAVVFIFTSCDFSLRCEDLCNVAADHCWLTFSLRFHPVLAPPSGLGFVRASLYSHVDFLPCSFRCSHHDYRRQQLPPWPMTVPSKQSLYRGIQYSKKNCPPCVGNGHKWITKLYPMG